MAQVWFTASFVGVLCSLSALKACTWDSNTELEQGLDPRSFDDGAGYLAHLPNISDAEECQQACCDKDECQLALIGTPADGKPECMLVSCMKDGKDVCVLMPSTQFKVYRKTQVISADEERQNEADVNAVNTTDLCLLPSVVGNCRAALPRFYYDATNQTCKQFIYGGCGGNNNNFETQKACETSCNGVTGTLLSDSHTLSQRSRMSVPENNNADEPKALPEMTSDEFQEKCQTAPQTGLCRASIRRYYYNNGTCEPFVYGGCGGNKNNYETEETCMTSCTVRIIPSNKKESDIPTTPNSIYSYQEICVVPSDSGPCRASFRRFYFDSSSQSCKPFIYGGCRGNQNRYSTEEECLSACAGKDGRFDEHGHQKDRKRWTPAFFLVATLTIMSALLLVGLILISVRRNSNRGVLILDDKEELLPAEEMFFDPQPKAVSN
ncbi:kunitz-type serine protease inhibitor 6-like [Myxocyprinus asiaticus]|uniref:kunitz-type serine protease inhibitor 6-like n=1 Tax=Myxocyprinus asiaticus TaxID=70543 RepID=UPI0022225966|nr:kunitz-type serine protease inhibitor 6-like [Myxocyprinus asiaticus]